jgi:hypothetical protein
MNISGLLQGIATLAWLGFIGVIVMIFIRSSRNQSAKGLSSVVIILLAVALITTALGAGIVYIQPEERGVVFSAFAEGGVRQRVRGLRARARLHGLRVHGHGAGRHPGCAHHHPLPAILDRLDAVVVEDEVGLIVHAVKALDDGFLQLVHDLGTAP